MCYQPGSNGLTAPLPAYRISAIAITTKRRAACQRGSADGRGQCDIGGVDPRPTGAMALAAPTLAGLAATIAKRNGGPKSYRRDPNRAPILLAISYDRARTPLGFG